MKPETVTLISAVVQAIAALVSTGVAIVLAWITYRYVKITRDILSETAKARTATETAANAALESVRLTKRQVEEETDIGETHLISTLTKAIGCTETLLMPEPLMNTHAPAALARLTELLKNDAGEATNHLARTDPEMAKKLSFAFEALLNGAKEVSTFHQLVDRGIGPGHSGFELTRSRATDSLKGALLQLEEARSEWQRRYPKNTSPANTSS